MGLSQSKTANCKCKTEKCTCKAKLEEIKEEEVVEFEKEVKQELIQEVQEGGRRL